jgi:hypothetical protein
MLLLQRFEALKSLQFQYYDEVLAWLGLAGRSDSHKGTLIIISERADRTPDTS